MACEKAIEIDTRLGRREIDPEKIITFPRGLAGFEEEHQFTLLPLRPDAPMLILQSINRAEVGLLVADPYSFISSYPVLLGDAEQQLLKVGSAAEAAILVTVAIPPGRPEDATLNLSGPIVINHQARIGLQIPQGFDGPPQVSLHALAQESARKEAEAAESMER